MDNTTCTSHSLTGLLWLQQALLADLSAMRDLCVQVEKTKESLSRQLATITVTCEQLQQQMADLQAERELVKQQVCEGQERG